MEISTQDYKRVTVMNIKGRIDGAAAAAFEEEIGKVRSQGKKNLVFDMSGVDFLSSSGLRVMLTTNKGVKDVGGRLCIAHPSERVVTTLEMAGLDVIFESMADREAAIGSY